MTDPGDASRTLGDYQEALTEVERALEVPTFVERQEAITLRTEIQTKIQETLDAPREN